MTQTQVAAPSASAGDGQGMDVRFVAGEAYEVMVRGHRVLVDQPPITGVRTADPPNGAVRGLPGRLRSL